MDCVQNSPALSSPTEESSGRSRSHKFEYLSFPSKFFLPGLLLNSFLNQLLFKLQEGANGARSDDIKRIKEELGTWINLDYKPIKLLDPKSRDGRGLQHDVCGGLLTPIQFDWQDAEYDLAICYVFVLSLFIRVRANIRNGADGFSLANKYFLSCLYPTGCGDQRKVEQRFLRSKLLLKVSHKFYVFSFHPDFSFCRSSVLSSHHHPQQMDSKRKPRMGRLARKRRQQGKRKPPRIMLPPF
jgi:hypothetical protein